MNKVLISCDTTADLGEELLARYNIKEYPLYITMGDKTLRDGIEVTPADVFDYYKRTGNLAGTAAPNIGDYHDFFKKHVEDGYEIVHFNISSRLSSSNNVAQMAASEFGCVYPIDSMHLSTGIGLLVIKAAELRDQGLSAKEIADKVNDMRELVDTSFVIDTLKYMAKGGRCSGVAALGANLLGLKPCLDLRDGLIIAGKKYRGKIENVISDYVKERLHTPETLDLERIFVTYTPMLNGDTTYIDNAIKTVKEIANFKEILTTVAGSSVSVHCGPGTLGVLFMRKEK